MKTLILTIITLFVVTNCIGQKGKVSKNDTASMLSTHDGYKDNLIAKRDYTFSKSFSFDIQEPPTYRVVIMNDTLNIELVGNLKAIKIGERIYKIESPTLTEVRGWVMSDTMVPVTRSSIVGILKKNK